MSVRYLGPLAVKRGHVEIGVTYSQGFSTRSDTIRVPLAHLADDLVMEALHKFVEGSLKEAWHQHNERHQPALPLEKWE